MSQYRWGPRPLSASSSSSWRAAQPPSHNRGYVAHPWSVGGAGPVVSNIGGDPRLNRHEPPRAQQPLSRFSLVDGGLAQCRTFYSELAAKVGALENGASLACGERPGSARVSAPSSNAKSFDPKSQWAVSPPLDTGHKPPWAVAQPADASSLDPKSHWAALVPKFRMLREALLSLGVGADAFTMKVYETAADVCLHAGDLGEYLKCQQHLLAVCYPAAGVRSAPRWPDFAAASLLYFVVLASTTGQGEQLELSIALRSMPEHLLQTRPVQDALRITSAVAAGNYVAVMRLHRATSSTLLRLLMVPLVVKGKPD
eukprot:jgi/Mesvir1/19052/Mv12814-RA.1